MSNLIGSTAHIVLWRLSQKKPMFCVQLSSKLSRLMQIVNLYRMKDHPSRVFIISEGYCRPLPQVMDINTHHLCGGNYPVMASRFP